MKVHSSILQEIRLLEGNLQGFLLDLPASLRLRAGQYFSAAAPEEAPLPTILYAAAPTQAGWLLWTEHPMPWRVGDRLSLRGPLGNGFALPEHARRVAFTALDFHILPLRMLISEALERGAAVTLFCDLIPEALPPQVELLPLEQLADAVDWADALAVDCPIDHLPALLARLNHHPRLAALPTQVLVRRAMPCAGVGACSICSQKMRRGYALACQDGPVFDLAQLEAE